MVQRCCIWRSITHSSQSVNDTLLLIILIIDWRKWSKRCLLIHRLGLTEIILIELFNIRCICEHLSIFLVSKLLMCMLVMVEHWVYVAKELSILGVCKLILLRVGIKCFRVIVILWFVNVQAIVVGMASRLCIWFWYFDIQNTVLHNWLSIVASVQIGHILHPTLSSQWSSSSISVFIALLQ